MSRGELTTRERQVLEGIKLGETNKAIAFKLGIKEGTIKTHVSNVLTKLHVKNRVQAALAYNDLMKHQRVMTENSDSVIVEYIAGYFIPLSGSPWDRIREEVK